MKMGVKHTLLIEIDLKHIVHYHIEPGGRKYGCECGLEDGTRTNSCKCEMMPDLIGW